MKSVSDIPQSPAFVKAIEDIYSLSWDAVNNAAANGEMVDCRDALRLVDHIQISWPVIIEYRDRKSAANPSGLPPEVVE